MSAAEVVEVRLLELPVPLWARAQEHTDELMREFALVAADARAHPDDTSVPAQLLRLVERLNRDYAGTSDPQRERLFAASDAGEQVLPELVFAVPAGAADAAAELDRMLDLADDYCRAGSHLLTLASPDELVAFRRWYLQEFRRQIAGDPPTPWPAYAATALPSPGA